MGKSKMFRIYLKGKEKTEDVKAYKRVGDKYDVTFHSGKTFSYSQSNVKAIDIQEGLKYLKKLADEVGIEIELDGGRNINLLSLSYAKIKSVPPKSVLGAFLSGGQELTFESLDSKGSVIYPFGFNISQQEAVEQALTHPLSIIQGPPGTGKTQTILNIIANATMRGQSVAVVSSNNSATKNVYEKLQKNGFDFIAASLGSLANKTDFIAEQKPVPDLKGWKLAEKESRSLTEKMEQASKEFQLRLLQQKELAKLRQQLSELATEERHFQSYSDEDLPVAVRKVRTSEECLELWLLAELESLLEPENRFISFVKSVISFLTFNRKKIFINKMKKTFSFGFLVSSLQKRFYQLKKLELEKSISEINRQLEAVSFAEKMKDYTEGSLKVFKSNLAMRFLDKNRSSYQIEDLRNEAESFIQDYPVVLSTTYSLKNSLATEVMYDYVIIDESSQVDLCTGALAMSCAKNVVVVGDLQQLPHVVDSEMAQATDKIFSEFNLPEAYRYRNQSLLSSLVTVFPKSPVTLLREHYRCHPKIIEFCNKKFYQDQLIILTEAKDDREPLMVYKTVEGNHARNRMNQRQIDIIKEEIIPQQGLSTSDGSLGVITPYRNQTNALQKAFEGVKVKADTVDKFQGQENSVVVLSTVDNEVTDFSDNANRLNVAISRAIDQLIVVVSDAGVQSDTNIGDLVRYIQYNNFSVVESKVHSVFDYLYSSYRDRRRTFLAKHKNVSRFDSENLMFAKLETILKEHGLNSLKIATHVPLRMLLKETALLTAEELAYVGHVATHVDFVVFDRLSRMPKLVVEVDGVQFHQVGSRQAARDLMKDAILKKYDLPLLRLRTDGSGEDRLLLAALKGSS